MAVSLKELVAFAVNTNFEMKINEAKKANRLI